MAHGVSRGEKCAITTSLVRDPVRGDRIRAEENFLSPLRGSDCQYRNPRLAPCATLLPWLRSYLPPFSKTDLCPGETPGSRATNGKRSPLKKFVFIRVHSWFTLPLPSSKSTGENSAEWRFSAPSDISLPSSAQLWLYPTANAGLCLASVAAAILAAVEGGILPPGKHERFFAVCK